MGDYPENPSSSSINTCIMSDPELGQEIKESIIDDGGPLYNMYMNKRRDFMQIYDQESAEKGPGALMIDVRGSNVVVSYLPTSVIQVDILSIIYGYIQVPLGTPGYKVVVLTGGDTMRVLEEYEQIIAPNLEEQNKVNGNNQDDSIDEKEACEDIEEIRPMNG